MYYIYIVLHLDISIRHEKFQHFPSKVCRFYVTSLQLFSAFNKNCEQLSWKILETFLYESLFRSTLMMIVLMKPFSR